MLVIRLQRTGRKGRANFRIVVQDSRQSPTSGKFVALIGNYDPHSKTLNVKKEQATEFIKNGARPSDRVARLLTKEGIKLPSWVKLNANKKRATRNAEKLRKNRPPETKEAKQTAEEEQPNQTDTNKTDEALNESDAIKAPETDAEPATNKTPVEEENTTENTTQPATELAQTATDETLEKA